MSKNDVFQKIGEPIHVDYGINGTIVWIYEVRTITVKSHTSSTGEISPNKTNDDVKHSEPIHRLKLIFVDNKVERWDVIDFEETAETTSEEITLEEKIEEKIDKGEITIPYKNAESENENSKVKARLKISPSIWLLSTASDRGAGLGVSMMKKKLGIELNFNTTLYSRDIISYSNWVEYNSRVTTRYNTFTGMGLYEYNYNDIIVQAGIGLSLRISMRINETGPTNTSEEGPILIIPKRVGVGKYFSYKKLNFLPMIEFQHSNNNIGINIMTRMSL